VLVNNAGITRDAPFHRMTPQQWHEVIDTNLSGLFNMTHGSGAGCATASSGGSSASARSTGRRGSSRRPTTPRPRPGDIGFTKALAQEGARAGITVNVIAPGYINTEMMAGIKPEVMENTILPAIPVGRLGEPEEIARCVVFLASDAAGFITGATLSANGGQYMA
jgi:acetoacetyl-CoA reductase